jgi:regulator of sigma E protease
VATWNTAFLELLDHSLSQQRIPIEVIDRDEQRRERMLDFERLGPDIDRSNLLANIGFDFYRPAVPAILGRIEPGGAAERAGFAPGDRIIAAGGETISDWDQWVKYVRDNPGRQMTVTVERDGRQRTLTLTPDRVASEEGPIGRIGAAVNIPADFGAELHAAERYSIGGGFVAAVQRTWDMSKLTINILVNMVSGNVAIANLGGPIRIAQYAGSSAEAGLTQFVSFIALISISLGVLNLLPVPVLDGGHLLYYLIELVKGSPLSDEAQMLGQRIGIVLLVGIMVLAFYNDIVQLVG